jgi:hypothetical protein
MILNKQDFLRIYKRFDFDIYLNNLDLSLSTKCKILDINDLLHGYLTGEEMLLIIEKVVAKNDLKISRKGI